MLKSKHRFIKARQKACFIRFEKACLPNIEVSTKFEVEPKKVFLIDMGLHAENNRILQMSASSLLFHARLSYEEPTLLASKTNCDSNNRKNGLW